MEAWHKAKQLICTLNWLRSWPNLSCVKCRNSLCFQANFIWKYPSFRLIVGNELPGWITSSNVLMEHKDVLWPMYLLRIQIQKGQHHCKAKPLLCITSGVNRHHPFLQTLNMYLLLGRAIMLCLVWIPWGSSCQVYFHCSKTSTSGLATDLLMRRSTSLQGGSCSRPTSA